MIYDSIAAFPLYVPVHPLFPVVLDFITDKNSFEIESGRINLDDGVYVVITRYKTDDIRDKFLECHRRYIDIQLLTEGIEMIGICNKNGCTTIEPYHEDKDFEKMSGAFDFITLKPGFFAGFFPQDCHMPGVRLGSSEETVNKIVVKIPL
jgi:YhcH/YjgK/YiaL family protein